MTDALKPWADRGSRHARGYGTAWDKLRKRIKQRDKGLCQPCQREGRVTEGKEVHHIEPKAKGGTDDPDNLELTCRDCHRKADLRNRGYRPKQEIGRDGYPV